MSFVPTIRDRIVELRRVKASELIPNERNWRKHPSNQQAAMTEMLNKIGYADALLARETDEGLVLIDGHLRAETTPDSIVPVLILDVDEKEADLLLATLDPLASMAETDKDNLAAIYSEIEIIEPSLNELLLELIKSEEQEEPPDVTEKDDEIPEKAPPFSKPGYIWDIGPHRLIVGDSTDPEVYEKLMSDGQADMVWTDPPYGVSYVGKTEEALTIQSDSMGLEEQESFLGAALTAACKWTKEGGAWYVASPSGPAILPFCKVLTALGIWRQGLIWVKDVFVMGRSDFHYRHEYLFYGWKPGAAHHEPPDRKQDTVWEIPRPKASRQHPTMKPVELVVRSLLMSSNKGDTVLDPFTGSGTTLVAAHRAGRVGRGIELDPHYADVILRRMQEVTGIRPVLTTSGQEYDFTQEFFSAQEEAMAQGDQEIPEPVIVEGKESFEEEYHVGF